VPHARRGADFGDPAIANHDRLVRPRRRARAVDHRDVESTTTGSLTDTKSRGAGPSVTADWAPSGLAAGDPKRISERRARAPARRRGEAYERGNALNDPPDSTSLHRELGHHLRREVLRDVTV